MCNCVISATEDNNRTGAWLMYHVRFAGGSVASEVQLMFIFSPTKYLVTEMDRIRQNINTQTLPALSSQYFRPIQGNNNDQHVPEGTVSGEHGSLLADLAPVPACAGQGEMVESYLVDT